MCRAGLVGCGLTTMPGGGRQGRRIDRVFVNRAGRGLVVRHRLRWDLGVATHAVWEVTLALGPPPTYPARVKAPSLAGPARAGWDAGAAAHALAAVIAARDGQFQDALASNDLDVAWHTLCGMAVAFLRRRLATPPAGCGQRKKGAQVLQQAAFQARPDRDGAAACKPVRAALLRLRRLENLGHNLDLTHALPPVLRLTRLFMDAPILR